MENHHFFHICHSSLGHYTNCLIFPFLEPSLRPFDILRSHRPETHEPSRLVVVDGRQDHKEGAVPKRARKARDARSSCCVNVIDVSQLDIYNGRWGNKLACSINVLYL